MRGWAHPDGDRRSPVLLALQCLPDCASLSRGGPRPGARCPGAARTSLAHHRAGPDTAPVAGGIAQGAPAGVWLVPHTLELCHTGPDVGSQARAHSLGRDHAALGARGGLGIERAFGDVHDCCTRDHRRKRLRDLVADVVEHLHVNGPWRYKLSDIYYEATVTAAVERMAMEQPIATAG
jgi:hypothetical protein